MAIYKGDKKVIALYKGDKKIIKRYKGTQVVFDSAPINNNTLSFEFTGDTTTYKLNKTRYTATTSPYTVSLADLGIETLTNCSQTFSGSSITELTSFPVTSGVTNMGEMFSYCRGLTSLDLSNFDTSNVTDMYNMFYVCNTLTSLDLSSFDTSNVTNMLQMFGNCMKLTTLDLSSFNTSNVKNMSSMFSYCSGLTSLDLSNFDTSNVTNIRLMFENCKSLTSLDLSGWDTSNVTKMDSMFKSCRSLTTLDLSSFNTSNVTTMNMMFYYCDKLTSLDVSNFNTSNITDMSYMFSYCESLTELDVSNFNTSNVTSMGYMFQNCKNLTSLDLSGWDISNLNEPSSLFDACKSLKTINLTGWKITEKWNSTTNNNVFRNCNSLETIILGETDQTTYDWVYSKLVAQNLQDQVTIIYSLPSDSCFVKGNEFTFEYNENSGLGNWVFLKENPTSNSLTYTATTNPYTITIDDPNIHVIQLNGIDVTKIHSLPDIKYSDLDYLMQYSGSCETFNFSCMDYSEAQETTLFKIPSACTTFIADDMKFKDDYFNGNDVYKMFNNASNLKYLSIKNWPTEQFTSCLLMFYYNKQLETIDVTGCKFSHITTHTSFFTTNNTALKTIILGNTTQAEYDWWYARLTNAGIQNQVTIEYSIT